MEFPIKFDTVKSEWSIIYILRGHRLYFSKNTVFLSLKIIFVLTNSVDPDEMWHYAAFHLGLQCLPKYLFSGFPPSKGKYGINVWKKQVVGPDQLASLEDLHCFQERVYNFKKVMLTVHL